MNTILNEVQEQPVTQTLTLEATYSPEDNKLRLYASERLSPELYQRIKALGFNWAPMQKLFVAPMWTPEREDVLLELCGSIGDETISVAERAGERAERFRRYEANRERDAHNAYNRVQTLTQGMPTDEPIIIGHNKRSEAERLAAKIERAMTETVNQWETKEYWNQRANCVMRHAAYKANVSLRVSRIGRLEESKRRVMRNIAEYNKRLTLLNDYPELYAKTYGSDGATLSRGLAHQTRWLMHYENRIAYENAFLQGQTPDAVKGKQQTFEVGGKVFDGRSWYYIAKVNARLGVVSSYAAKPLDAGERYYAYKLAPGEVLDYVPPEEGAAEQHALVRTQKPLVNCPGDDMHSMTKAEYAALPDRSRDVRRSRCGTYRYRFAYREEWKQVYLTDSKLVPIPGGA